MGTDVYWPSHFQELREAMHMGLVIKLEDERGACLEWVDDPQNVLHRLLPSCEDPTFRYLNGVDRYGDTTFNRIQIGVVIEELARLEKAGDAEAKAMLRRILALARRCDEGSHLYLKFYGD